jgi:S1-C subfamily serine protease
MKKAVQIGIVLALAGWAGPGADALRAQGASPEAESGTSSAALPTALVRATGKPSVVRVNVTSQAWDFVRPWGKRPPLSKRAVGAVLKGQRVLVTGELVANANYVELETPDGAAKVPASIEVVDYESNLALLKAEDASFLNGFAAAAVEKAVAGDGLSVLQLENTGTVLATRCVLSTVEVGRYPFDDAPLLLYRTTVPLQFRDSGFTLPVFKDGALAGMVMRYDNGTKSAELVPAPVIEHFLKDAADGRYEGFPRVGMAYSNMRDPQFRRYTGMPEGVSGGVYVTDVLKGGPAEAAGLKAGDVLLEVAGHPVDHDGNYADPVFGRLSITHLIGRHFSGESLVFTVLRNRQKMEIRVKVESRPARQQVVEPYVVDRAPSFYLLGGLLFQELSRQYLKEWGAEWTKKAPEEFLYLDRHQAELYPEGNRKVVVLTGVLPSESTIGYESLAQIVLEKINGTLIRRVSDIPAALAQSKDGMHRIDFDSDPGTIYMDAASVAAGDEELRRNYRIPILKRVD